MKSWTEFHIGMVYYSGLFLSMLIGILLLVYLKPMRAIEDILKKKVVFWSRSLMSTVLMSGMLGAMSICFNGCDGYDDLIDHPELTLQLGQRQISTASVCFLVMLGVWFLILHTLRMQPNWKDRFRPFIGMITVGMVIASIVGFYSIVYA